jgi:nucleoside phosphorylase
MAAAIKAPEVISRQVDVAVLVSVDEEFRAAHRIFKVHASAGKVHGIQTAHLSGSTYSAFNWELPVGDALVRGVTVQAGKGMEASAATAKAVAAAFSPSVVVVLGISCGLAGAVSVGDVLVPNMVHNYLGDAGAVSRGDAGRSAGGAGAADAALLAGGASVELEAGGMRYPTLGADDTARMRGFSTGVPRYDAWYMAGKQRNDAVCEYLDGTAHAADVNLAPVFLRNFADNSAHVASANIEVTTAAFAQWLQSHVDRSILAADMESGAVVGALASLSLPPRVLVVRGISQLVNSMSGFMAVATAARTTSDSPSMPRPMDLTARRAAIAKMHATLRPLLSYLADEAVDNGVVNVGRVLAMANAAHWLIEYAASGLLAVPPSNESVLRSIDTRVAGVLEVTEATRAAVAVTTSHAAEGVRLVQESHGKLDAILVAVAPPPAPPIDELAYARAIIAKYERVTAVEAMGAEGSSYRSLLWSSVFIPQDVREAPHFATRTFEVPHELEESLWVAGPPATPSPGDGGAKVAASRRDNVQQPVRSVLEVLVDAEQTRVILLGHPGAGKTSVLIHQMLQWARAVSSAPSDGTARRDSLPPFPLLVELRQFAYEHDTAGGALDLVEYLSRGRGPCYPLPLEALRTRLSAASSSRCCLLIDGLDEVFDLRQRNVITQHILAFAAAHPSARIVISSRVVGYNAQPWQSSEFRQFMVQQLNPLQIQQFLTKWHAATHTPEESAAHMGRLWRLQQAMQSSPPIAQLAGNPLLLTMMAIVNRSQELPRERCELYRKCVELLLVQWDTSKALSPAPGLSTENSAVIAALSALRLRDKLQMLQDLAWGMQDGRGHLGNAVTRDELEKVLTPHIRLRVERTEPAVVAAALIDQLRLRHYILCFLGDDTFAFMHRTFLEYFAALHINARFSNRTMSEAQLVALYVDRWQDTTWHEVLCLVSGMLPTTFAAQCVHALLDVREPAAVLLAGQCFAEMADTHLAEDTKLALWPELTALAQHPRGNASVMAAATRLVATIWVGNEQARQWLFHATMSSKPRAVEAVALLATYWHGHPATLPQLCFLAESDKATAGQALLELATRWRDDGQTLALLARIAHSNKASAPLAVQLVAAHWAESATTLPLLMRVGGSGMMGAGQAILAVGARWPAHPAFMPLLLRVAQTPLPSGEQAVTVLATRFQGHQETRQLLSAVAKSASPTAPLALRRLVHGWPEDPELLPLLQHIAMAVNPAAIEAVAALCARWHQREDTRQLVKRLAASNTPGAIRAVAELADRWGDKATVSVLCAVAATNNLGAPQAILELATRWSEDPRVLPLLTRVAQSDSAAAVCAVAMLGITWHSHPDTVGLLLPLAQRDSPAGVKAVTVLAARWRDDEGTLQAVRAAVGRGAPWAVNVLVACRHDDATQQFLAHVAAGQSAAAGAALLALVDEYRGSAATLSLLQAVAVSNSALAPMAISEWCDGWPDTEEQRRVLEGVARSRKPGAAQALAELADNWSYHEHTLPLLRQLAIAATPAAAQAIVELSSRCSDSDDNETRMLMRGVASSATPAAPRAIQALAVRWREHADTLPLVIRLAATDSTASEEALVQLATQWRGSDSSLSVMEECAASCRPSAATAIFQLAHGWRSRKRTLYFLKMVVALGLPAAPQAAALLAMLWAHDMRTQQFLHRLGFARVRYSLEVEVDGGMTPFHVNLPRVGLARH